MAKANIINLTADIIDPERSSGCSAEEASTMIYLFEQSQLVDTLDKIDKDGLFTFQEDSNFQIPVQEIIFNLVGLQTRTGEYLIDPIINRESFIEIVLDYYRYGISLDVLATKYLPEINDTKQAQKIIAETISVILNLLYRLANLNLKKRIFTDFEAIFSSANQRFKKGYGNNSIVLLNVLGDWNRNELLQSYVARYIGNGFAKQVLYYFENNVVSKSPHIQLLVDLCSEEVGYKFFQTITTGVNQYGRTRNSNDTEFEYIFAGAVREFIKYMELFLTAAISLEELRNALNKIFQSLYEEFNIEEEEKVPQFKNFIIDVVHYDFPELSQGVGLDENKLTEDFLIIYNVASRENRAVDSERNIEFVKQYWTNILRGDSKTTGLGKEFAHASERRNILLGRLIVSHPDTAMKHGFHIVVSEQGKDSLVYEFIHNSGWRFSARVSPQSFVYLNRYLNQFRKFINLNSADEVTVTAFLEELDRDSFKVLSKTNFYEIFRRKKYENIIKRIIILQSLFDKNSIRVNQNVEDLVILMRSMNQNDLDIVKQSEEYQSLKEKALSYISREVHDLKRYYLVKDATTGSYRPFSVSKSIIFVTNLIKLLNAFFSSKDYSTEMVRANSFRRDIKSILDECGIESPEINKLLAEAA